MRALVDCALGTAVVEVDGDELVGLGDDPLPPRDPVTTGLPLVVAADRRGALVVAVVERRPPLVVSTDAGSTWRESGAGLPAGRDVAISPEHPDRILFAGDERLFLSVDGGRFWRALAVELPQIRALRWEP
jgi:hypothetical protein